MEVQCQGVRIVVLGVVLVVVMVVWLRGSTWHTCVGVEVRCGGVSMVVLEVRYGGC